MTIVLRDYQEEALQFLFDYWKDDKGRSPVVCAPTGSGKSLMIASFCKRVCDANPNVRIMILAHVRELLTQNQKELLAVWPEASTGIYSAGLGKKQINKRITFAGIQSVYSKVFSFPKIDIVIVDECHLVPRNTTTRYRRFFSDMFIFNPSVAIAGFSATPFRLDSGMIHEGDDAIFDGIAYSVDMRKLIDEGYLVPVVSRGGVKKIDTSHVHIRCGEFAQNELAHAADSPELVRLAVEEIVAYGEDRKAWLLFCCGIVHSQHVADEVRKHGIECKTISGDTPKEERDIIINDFKTGKLRAIANVGVMTTGVNIPRCDLIALLTATESAGRYIQMVGRAMRPYPDKTDALLLDYGGNCERFGVIDDISPVRERNIFNVVKNAEPVKECPNCRAIIHSRMMTCPVCDFVFTATAAHGTESYSGAVLKDQQEPFFVSVVDTWYSRHKKSGKPDILKIAMYDANDTEFPIWCCLGHGGYAREKAVAVVKQFGGHTDNVTDSLKESPYWKKPKTIKVVPNGKFYNVVGIEFNPADSKQVTFGEGV